MKQTFGSSGQERKKKKVQLTEAQQREEEIEEQRKYWYEKCGIAEDHSIVDMGQVKSDFKQKLLQRPKEISKNIKKKDLESLKKEIEEVAAASQWPELENGTEYYKRKFLFPFGDIAPIVDKGPQATDNGLLHGGGGSFGQIQTDVDQKHKDAFHKLCRVKYQLPQAVAERKQEWVPELRRPISITVPDIRRELGVFISKFPRDKIPHSNENEHHLRDLKKRLFKSILQGEKIKTDLSMDDEFASEESKSPIKTTAKEKSNTLKDLNQDQRDYVKKKLDEYKKVINNSVKKENESKNGFQDNLHFLKSFLTEEHINATFDEIRSERVAKLVGLCAHFVYWCVFGNFNELPLDDYHMKQLLISALQVMSVIEARYNKSETMRKLFCNFMMPMILLSLRLEIEIIFKMNYRSFLKNYTNDDINVDVSHQTLTQRLINGVITEVFDPNIFYSRLSFLESGKDGIDIKYELNAGKVHNGYKLPNIQNKFYTRSALVKNLIPVPSEGKVRAQFQEKKNQVIYPKVRTKPSIFPMFSPQSKLPHIRSQEQNRGRNYSQQQSQDQQLKFYNSSELNVLNRGTVVHRNPLNQYSQDLEYNSNEGSQIMPIDQSYVEGKLFRSQETSGRQMYEGSTAMDSKGHELYNYGGGMPMNANSPRGSPYQGQSLQHDISYQQYANQQSKSIFTNKKGSSVSGAPRRDGTQSVVVKSKGLADTMDPHQSLLNDQLAQEQQMLDMINKVQMFQIACNKVNRSLKQRKLKPVFDLQISQQKKEDRVRGNMLNKKTIESPGKDSHAHHVEQASKTNESPVQNERETTLHTQQDELASAITPKKDS